MLTGSSTVLRKHGIEVVADQGAGAVQPRFHSRARDAELLRDGISGVIFNVPQGVHSAIFRRERCDCVLEELLHLPAGQLQFRCGIRTGDLAALVFQRGKLKQGQQGFPLFELPADPLGDLREPGAEGGRVPELVEVTGGFQQSFNQDVFRVLAIAAGANELPINDVFVLAREGVEVVRNGVGHKSMLAALTRNLCVWNHRPMTNSASR